MEARPGNKLSDKAAPAVGLTMFGVTTICVDGKELSIGAPRTQRELWVVFILLIFI